MTSDTKTFLTLTQGFYSDNASELEDAAKKRGWCDDSAVQGRPKTNDLAASKVDLVLGGTRSVLLQAGMENQLDTSALPGTSR